MCSTTVHSYGCLILTIVFSSGLCSLLIFTLHYRRFHPNRACIIASVRVVSLGFSGSLFYVVRFVGQIVNVATSSVHTVSAYHTHS